MKQVKIKEIAEKIVKNKDFISIYLVGVNDCLMINHIKSNEIGAFYIQKTSAIHFCDTMVVFGNDYLSDCVCLDTYETEDDKIQIIFEKLRNFFRIQDKNILLEKSIIYIGEENECFEDLENLLKIKENNKNKIHNCSNCSNCSIFLETEICDKTQIFKINAIEEGFDCDIFEKVEQDDFLEEKWSEFGDVTMNPDTECIETDWYIFKNGTCKEEIWHWFDELHSKGVAFLMYRNQE